MRKVVTGPTGLYAGVSLQWGRNMRVAERQQGRLPKKYLDDLQWGRNMRVAERSCGLWRRGWTTSFNGAAT